MHRPGGRGGHMHILQVSAELPIAAPLNQFHIFLHCLDQGEEDNGVDNQIINILLLSALQIIAQDMR